MVNNPDFSDVEVSERPTDRIIEGKVVSVVKDERQNLYDVNQKDLKYGSVEDELVQIEVEVQFKDFTFTVYEDLPFYQQPSDQSMFGSFINRYGRPEVGQTVKVDFDDEGQGQIRNIRSNN